MTAVQNKTGTLYKIFLKRLCDLLGSIFILILSAWLFLLIILVYLGTFQRPVFFFQDRIGENEKTFRMIKFRTLKLSGDNVAQRRFWLGDFLRFTSMDELPQLLNVLKGEMSLVGPRPLPVEYLPLFSPAQRKRHAVKPGITGWAQVNGRNSISWEEKFTFDLHYVNNLSCLLDFKIIVKTIQLILSFKSDISLQEKRLGE